MRAAVASVTPEREPGGRRGRLPRLALGAVVAVLLCATAAGAWVARETLLDLGPQAPGGPALPTRGEPLGTERGIRYVVAGGSTAGSRCLVRVGVEPGFVRASSCLTRDEFAQAGGLAVTDRPLSGSRQHGPYVVAGMVPEGITCAAVGGRRVPVRNGFFVVALDHRPPIDLAVSGPEAPAIARNLEGHGRSTFLSSGAEGPSYRILVTPGAIPVQALSSLSAASANRPTLRSIGRVRTDPQALLR